VTNHSEDISVQELAQYIKLMKKIHDENAVTNHSEDIIIQEFEIYKKLLATQAHSKFNDENAVTNHHSEGISVEN